MTSSRTTRFSLLELVVVMVLLTTLTALVAPRLSGFFRGRRLDDDARRLWALARHARAEAIAHAVPVRLWLDPVGKRYGVEAVPGYGHEIEALSYDLTDDVRVTPEPAGSPSAEGEYTLTWWPDGSLAESNAGTWAIESTRDPGDVWRLVRQGPLSTYTLTREEAL